MSNLSKLYRKMQNRSQKWRETNDCTVKALAIAAGKTYEQAHGALALRGRNYRKGTAMFNVFNALRDFGFTEKEVYRHSAIEKAENPYYWDCEKTQEIAKKMRRTRWAKGRTMKSIEPHLPKRGVYIIQTSSHVLCVRAGQIHDWTSQRRHRITHVHHITRAGVNRKE
tara:strand:+ start:76 stop:579 length:504 start_codon:yes stop_codon:yes gene_type:complete